MSERFEARKDAYRYICENLKRMWVLASTARDDYVISLDELSSLKEGEADPSPEMVALVRRLFGYLVGDAEIDAYLVTPFEHKPDSA